MSIAWIIIIILSVLTVIVAGVMITLELRRRNDKVEPKTETKENKTDK